MKTLLWEIKSSVVVTLILLVTTCAAYPLVVWVGAQTLFRDKANGSLVYDAQGRLRGSSLLAQNFAAPGYFHPRPSAAGTGYDATSSGGTNLGPTSRKLADSVQAAVAAYRTENGLSADATVPADAVTSSASGLDPDISLANAEIQARRVARVRNLPLPTVLETIRLHTQDRDLGVFGEPRVNVLGLNLALDGAAH